MTESKIRSGPVRRLRAGIILLAILASIALAVAPAAYADELPDETVMVVTSILPQAHFVERIGGAAIKVDVLVGPGQSPATYEPTPKQMANLSQSAILFAVGVPFERPLLGQISEMIPHLRVVRTQDNIPNELHLEMEDHAHHDSDYAHDHGELDPHIWLDPALVKIQSRSICDALAEAMPEKREFFEANYVSFASELDSIDSEISRILEPVRGRELLVFHPAFGHFARAYGLKQIAIEHEGKEPGAGMLARFVERTGAHNVRVIFVQEQFSTAAATAVAEAIGARVVTLDPLARDYSTNMIKMATTIAKSLQEK